MFDHLNVKLGAIAFAGPLPNDRAMLLVAYSVVIAMASLAGGGILRVIRLTHTRMQVMMSFVGGLMLGIALFQLLPHAVEETGNLDYAVYALAGGLIFMFLLIRAFHFHAHDAAVEEPHEHPHGAGCSHGHTRDTGPAAHELSWIGVLLGLAIHTLIDGVALGAAIESAPGSAGWFAGIGTFAAIALHKPLDALSIGSVMTAAGRSPVLRSAVNMGFALMCPVGAAVFMLGVRHLTDTQHLVTGIALGFSAGAFLCIALGDLLPELEFHSHDRVKLSLALLAGLALAFVIEKYGHAEGHVHPKPVTAETAGTFGCHWRVASASDAILERTCRPDRHVPPDMSKNSQNVDTFC